ncbi:hypothetical protein CRG98_041842 [Punica granatum]|uniref:Uncharacterized protein n=1 Tax=Punica granatum TaxID=22663 RepID=A0A2I0I1C8_PUNGR|nr:hypothetical protein CRG98_041842 [Punica granatum]
MASWPGKREPTPTHWAKTDPNGPRWARGWPDLLTRPMVERPLKGGGSEWEGRDGGDRHGGRSLEVALGQWRWAAMEDSVSSHKLVN